MESGRHAPFVYHQSRRRKKESTAQLEALLKLFSFPHEVVYTKGEGHAMELARQAAETGEPVRIYAAAGTEL